MQLLADENIHPVIVARLRDAGFDVEYVRETGRGMKDPAILSRPDIGLFILITGDRDFGDLIFNQGYPAPLAILYQRLNRLDPDGIADRLLNVLGAGEFEGRLMSITRDGDREKAFPTWSRE